MPGPLVSIILLNWNGEKHIHKCVEHVLSQSHKNIEVIIVDNCSTDGSINKLRQKYPDFIYELNKENRGFAVGMNQGIELSKGDFVIPLNQDVCMHKDFVTECVNRIQKDNKIGAIGGRVYSWIGDELTNVLRKGEGELFFFRKRFQGYGGLRSEGEAFVFMPTGSFPFLRREMLEDVKRASGDYYDRNFVTGWEDVDLFFRMQLRDWKCLFFPAAFGWHVGSGSVGGNSTFFSKKLDYQTRVLRNRFFVIIKVLPINILLWLFPYLAVTEIAMVPYFLVRSPKSIIALVNAWRQVFMLLPDLLRKRGLIQKNIIVEKNYLKRFFVTF